MVCIILKTKLQCYKICAINHTELRTASWKTKAATVSNQTIAFIQTNLAHKQLCLIKNGSLMETITS